MKRLILPALLLFSTCAYAYTPEELCKAIYKAENSKAHPYGILAKYKHTTPKQACKNTVNHALKDWNHSGDFIAFLGSRYCPIGSDTDNGTCKNWTKNVKFFLQKGN